MENEKEKNGVEPPFEWFDFKGRHVAMKGDMILCIVEPAEGLPCEAWHIQPVAGLYTTVESAKSEAEKGHARFIANQAEDEKPEPNFYLEVLKQVVAALEAKAQKP
jgi:hypothetical protein